MNANKILKNYLSLNMLIKSWPYKLPDIKNIHTSLSHINLINSKDAPPRIALIDTGVGTSHPCFSGAHIVSKDFSGYSNPADEIGHDTHCAAILIAQENSGMTGLVPKAVLYSAKIIGQVRRDRSFTEKSIVQAIKWAIREDAQESSFLWARRPLFS